MEQIGLTPASYEKKIDNNNTNKDVNEKIVNEEEKHMEKTKEKNDEKINENKQKENNTNNDAEYCNEINIVYKIDNQKKIRIFGYYFVENNKSKCKIEFENKEYDLIECFYIENYTKNKLDYLRIKLKNINNVTDMGCMFYDCSSLSSLPNISKWNTKNVTNMGGMFYGCESLSSLPDISYWNTSNVTNMSEMFRGCSSLSSLPDISIWNICFMNVHHYHHYQIYQNGILIMLKI